MMSAITLSPMSRVLLPPVQDLQRERSEHELLRERIMILEGQLIQAEEFARNAWSEDERDLVGEAMDLCRSCQGIPRESINRCPMCRKLQEVIHV
jgi:hypothetical protein